MRALIKALAPPILLDAARRMRGPRPLPPAAPAMALQGDFASWADAQAASRGYEDPELIGRVLQRNLEEMAALQEGRYRLTDRDLQIAAAVMAAGARLGRPFQVEDFGGEMGGFFRVVRQLAGDAAPRWRVIETAPMAAAAEPHFAGDGLSFLADPAWRPDGDVVIVSGVLQTLPDPLALFELIADSRAPFVVITTSPFMDGDRDAMSLRVVRGGEESYPLWAFAEGPWRARIAKRFDTVAEWTVAKQDTLPDGRRLRFPGLLLQRR